MSEERHPRSERADRAADEDGQSRKRIERILPDIVKKVVERGVERLIESPENVRHFVEELKLPKEIASYLFVQIDETKNGLYRAVAKEIRDFLEHTDLSETVTKTLTRLSFEVKTEIRFIPNDAAAQGADGKFPKPNVRASVNIRSDKGDKDRPKEK